ncbi:MAG: hypothetical protein ACRDHF_03975 [Tepidiformaceae bacterium]
MTTGGSQSAPPSRLRLGVSEEAYQVLRRRLELNFRIALWTNIVALVVLLGGAGAATLLLLFGQPVAAAVPSLVALADVVYGAVERPWKQLWLANNRLALSESVWIAYLETMEALHDESLTDEQRARLLSAHNLWISRTAAIGQDDFVVAVRDVRAINDAAERLLSRLNVDLSSINAALEGYTKLQEGSIGGALDELDAEAAAESRTTLTDSR